MVNHIRVCPKCGRYCLDEICSYCDVETILPKPPKFSIEDHYGKYRREIKKQTLIKEGLL